MPVLNLHLAADQHGAEQIESLLMKCGELFAEVLKCAVDRIRVFVTEHAAPPNLSGRAADNGSRSSALLLLLSARRAESSIGN